MSTIVSTDNSSVVAWLATLPAEWMQDVRPAAIEAARASYAEGARHYHTWSHVLACIEALRGFPSTDPQITFLGLVFHDAIYTPGDALNEARSAQVAQDVLTRHSVLTRDRINLVLSAIEATRTHQLPRDGAIAAAAVLDIDMSILGASWETYSEYAQAIRREFVPMVVDEAQFAKGRQAFITKLLDRPRIYLSAAGMARWEVAARRNLDRELAALEAEMKR